MTYKLAKELQDGGFPQKLVYGDKCYPHRDYEIVITMHGSDHTDDCGPGICDCECDYCYPFACKDGIKIPTLSELFEACSDRFGELHKNNQGYWVTWDPELIGGNFHAGPFGSPEEALAKLWLGLNKKD